MNTYVQLRVWKFYRSLLLLNALGQIWIIFVIDVETPFVADLVVWARDSCSLVVEGEDRVCLVNQVSVDLMFWVG